LEFFSAANVASYIFKTLSRGSEAAESRHLLIPWAGSIGSPKVKEIGIE
jgi:hypothetical protein